ncbi:MAG: GTPase [Deltaproteobacteria bacterium]|nr:GTPase [Deltaproteobacteria bacterium]
MAIFNYKKREISAKIVYYGPALCGKTTNVQYIHQKLNPRQRGELVSLATDADRTLFFDFLPIELENVGGFKTRFQIYTVPGQVYYNSTRKAVLTGVDGVIFVADSQTSMRDENIESFNNLIENLKYYNRDISQIPMVLQYNKRDLGDVMSIEELDQLFSPYQVAHRYPASAVSGQGVLETLTTCCKLVLQDLKRKSIRSDKPAAQAPGGAPSAGPQSVPSSGPTAPSATGTAASTPLTGATIPGPETVSPQPAPGIDDPTEISAGFKPEIVQIGKPRLKDSYTLTIPLRLATDADQRNLLSVDITFTINGILEKT